MSSGIGKNHPIPGKGQVNFFYESPQQKSQLDQAVALLSVAYIEASKGNTGTPITPKTGAYKAASDAEQIFRTAYPKAMNINDMNNQNWIQMSGDVITFINSKGGGRTISSAPAIRVDASPYSAPLFNPHSLPMMNGMSAYLPYVLAGGGLFIVLGMFMMLAR